MTSEFIETNGIRLHYLQWGEARPPLIILHGNGHCGGVYQPLAEKLATDFRVLAVDLRGHGLSDKPDSYAWHELREDVLGVVEALDLRDGLLVGHSRGGGVSLLAAAKAPGRFRGVLAYEPSVPRLFTNPDRMLEVAARTENRRSTFATRQEMYDHFRDRGAFKGWREEYLRAYVRHGAIELASGGVALASPPHVEAQVYRALIDRRAWDENQGSPVPVRVIFGERGARLQQDADPVAALRTMFHTVETQVLPDCTHSGPMEHPDSFEAAIRDFSAAVARPGA